MASEQRCGVWYHGDVCGLMAGHEGRHVKRIHVLLEQIARLTSENARLKRENAALREALLSDCPTVEGDRDHPCWCEAGALNHLQDCWTKRAALAARGGEA